MYKDCKKCDYHYSRTIYRYKSSPCYNCKWNKIKDVHSEFKDNFELCKETSMTKKFKIIYEEGGTTFCKVETSLRKALDYAKEKEVLSDHEVSVIEFEE